MSCRFRRSIAVSFAALAFVLVSLGALARADALHAALDSISVRDIRGHLEILADEAMEGREAGTAGGRAAAAYLVEQLASFGWEPGGDADTFLQRFDGGRHQNVLAVFAGSDSELRREYVLVGAHYDHIGYGTSRNSRGPWGRVHPGADDNASGVAGVLEVAQAVTLLDPPPRRSILVALWDGEEKGMLGSKHWVSQPTVPLSALAMAFNADMIGRLREQTLHVFGTRTARGLRRWISEHNQRTDLALDISWETKAHSDHYPFVEQGVPALMLHTGLHDDWHRPTDRVENINHEGISTATHLLLSLVVDAANRPDRFTFRHESRTERPADRGLLERPIRPRPPRLGISWRHQEGDPPGVTLTHVRPGSPADRAGLLVEDRLVRFGSLEPVDDKQLGVAIWTASSDVTTAVWRDSSELLEIAVELDGEPVRYGISWREDPGEPGTVVLTEVVPLSPAHWAGLQVSDRIYRLEDQSFPDGNEFARRLSALSDPVSFLIERNGRLKTVSVDAPSAP